MVQTYMQTSEYVNNGLLQDSQNNKGYLLQQDFLPTIVDVSGRGPNHKKQIPYSQYKNTLKHIRNRDKALNMTTTMGEGAFADSESAYMTGGKTLLRGR